jgi:acetone carboxylase beta subunit
LGGAIKLDVAHRGRHIKAQIADPLGLSVEMPRPASSSCST